MKSYVVEIRVVRHDEADRLKWVVYINGNRVPGEFFSSRAAERYACTVLRSDYGVEPPEADFRISTTQVED